MAAKGVSPSPSKVLAESQKIERVIMCAIDGSEQAKYAFNWYLTNIWRASDLLVLVHIPQKATLSHFSPKAGLNVPVANWKESLEKRNNATANIVDDYIYECTKRKIKHKLRGEHFKQPGEGICLLAHEENADLIVMGSQGEGTLKRMIMGSVSEYVVKNVGIPVLVVRNKGFLPPDTSE